MASTSKSVRSDPPGTRFIYLSWGTVDHDETFTMFRRAKLWLDCVNPAVAAAAERSGLLVGELGLTDTKGHPLCAGTPTAHHVVSGL